MKLIEGQYYKCFYCDKYFPYKLGKKSKQITIDHFYPLSVSGINNSSNKVLACYNCNRIKKSRIPDNREVVKFGKYGRDNLYQTPITHKEYLLTNYFTHPCFDLNQINN